MEFGQSLEGVGTPSEVFDKEAEKKHRGEIRKALEKGMHEELRANGFKRSGKSTWLHPIGKDTEIVYLQRSNYGHSYYVEAGVHRGSFVPSEKTPTIYDCRDNDRNRLGYIVQDLYKREHADEPDVEEKAFAAKMRIDEALNFEIPDAKVKYPNEVYPPSVSMDIALQKIEVLREATKTAIPAWFEQRMTPSPTKRRR